jgi:hypothetical protein
VDDRDRRELDRLHKAYQAGLVLALVDACAYCAEWDIEVPTWAVKAIPPLLAALLQGKSPRHRGPGGNPIAYARRIYIDYDRWSTVEEVRERQVGPEWPEYLGLVNDPNLGETERKRLIQYSHLDPGRTLEDAFRIASELLVGTRSSGSPRPFATAGSGLRKRLATLRRPRGIAS